MAYIPVIGTYIQTYIHILFIYCFLNLSGIVLASIVYQKIIKIWTIGIIKCTSKLRAHSYVDIFSKRKRKEIKKNNKNNDFLPQQNLWLKLLSLLLYNNNNNNNKLKTTTTISTNYCKQH